MAYNEDEKGTSQICEGKAKPKIIVLKHKSTGVIEERAFMAGGNTGGS